MIPTSVTNSPPPAGLAQNGASVSVLGAAAGVGGGLGITINGPGTLTAGNGAGGGAAAATAQNNYNSIVLGLASLILEGRPISDDEYQHQVGKGAGGSNGATVTSSGSTGSGRLSPRPSTSRAAINITTNPYNPRLSYNGLGVGGGGTSSSSNSSSNNTTTHQRWTQKLCQLRQVSPAAQSMSMEPELVALAINDVATEHGGAVGGGGGGTSSSSGEFEIVRRVLLNRAGLGGGGGLGAVGSGGGGTNNSSAASSPGSNSSDNILHSLQSLATTCLRGGSGPTASNNLNLPLPMPMPMSMAMPLPQFGETRPFSLDFNYIPPSRSTITAAAASSNSPSIATATATTTTTASTTTATNSRPKHGPHCDQFLRKMGLAKGQDSANDNEEHFCDMSYVNITCSRWRAYCLKMDAILARREPGVCIEVYLGPVSHRILLEQWIITSKEKVPPPTMTLPSLCSAIRSQLYFSQIVAWCDLLRKCDPSVYDSGRVIFANGNGNNAGDLATTTTASSGTTSSPSQSSSSSSTRRPRLNIFYRIKQHDPNGGGGGGGGAAGLDGAFNAKANVHNFPYVNIAENISISVCVKSLPRINGGLPQVGPVLVAPQRMLRAACTPTNGGGFQAATPTGLGARIAIVGASPGNGLARANCDKNKANSPPKQMVELLAEEEDDQLGRDDLDGSGGSLSHRERQLQKYRKRMQRRDKKRERKPSLERQPMEQEPEDLEPEQEPMEEEAQAMVMTLAQPRRIAMISTGTQTSLSSCQQCGREKTLLCLNCSNGEDDHSDVENGQTENDNEDTGGSGSEMEDISSCSLSSGDLIVGTPRNNAELLLQAIQRTPKNRQSRDLNRGSRAAAGAARNNNQPKAAASTGGCQLCKRQKTQHHFGQAKQEQIKQETTPIPTNGGHQMEEEEGEQQSIASTKLTPNIERCSLNAITERCQTPPLPLESTNNMVGQFKTPQLKLDTHSPLPMPTLLTLARPMPTKPSQLRLNCSGSGLPQMYDNETPPPTTSPLLRKALPKVNLTTIFCSSAPITIGSGSSSTSQASSSSLAFCFDPSTLSHAQSQLIPSDLGNNLTVQKSFSAPTLPNVSNSSSSSTLSISPRFAKQAAAASFYKRRSRHLSDRSDRSSLGSDEQLSDEDLESAGMFSPAGSPMKCRSRLASHFAHRPLLGNLEESLLQRRLMPKIEVQGFKLLLGASGGFCPTQLTIPAASYFYELPGETLSTPYMCEIRMPRKGYSVPRTGTLQATLLNPMGTVVRMFVIPYDMRDMPPLHRTFIRQRILAEEANPCLQQQQQQQQQQQEKEQVQPRSPTTTSTTSKLGHFITAEQMKRLRYSIHLRFQTSRSGRLSLHTDIRLLISRRTDCDTAAAHAKGVLEAPNELITDTLMPQEPRYSSRQESSSASSKI